MDVDMQNNKITAKKREDKLFVLGSTSLLTKQKEMQLEIYSIIEAIPL